MPNKKKLVILVAEDHPVNRKVIGLLLESLSVQVDFANDGREAIEAAERFDYGLILMDCLMPFIDGFEAAFEIRKREFRKIRHTPIIACTSMDLDLIIDRCVHAGINDFIGKPINMSILKDKIDYWSLIPTVLNVLPAAVAAKIHRLEANIEPIDRDYLKLMYGLQQLDDVLELFLTVTESLLSQLQSAIGNKNIALVCHMAHEIKGSSYTVSAREMAKLCLDLETAGQKQNWTEVEKLYVALGLAFARVRQHLQNKDKLLQDIQLE